MRADGVVWDEATDAYHEAIRRGRCPDPLPPPPRMVARFDGDALVLSGLYAVTRASPRIRIDPDVPYARIALLLDTLRDSGHRQVELRQIRCRSPTTCRAEGLRVGLDPQHPVQATVVRLGIDGPTHDLVPAPTSDGLVLDSAPPEDPSYLTIRESETGWVFSFGSVQLAPGCEAIAFDRVDSVKHDAGANGLVACLHHVKRTFPEETLVAFVPRGSTPWREVAAQIAVMGGDGNTELFPDVFLPTHAAPPSP